jgi:nicotinamidase/pyrazinamidase
MRGSLLGIIDLQRTFMPGGSLPVPYGYEIVPTVNRLLARFPGAFATQDWHPAGHSSFASSHPGHAPYDRIIMPYGEQVLWPDHAVQGTPEAELHPDLDTARLALILRKGTNPDIDSYSAFFENDHRTPTGLHGWLRDKGVKHIFLAGLAFDFCVAWSAIDAVQLGFAVTVIADACRGIGLPAPAGETTIDTETRRLIAAGIRIKTIASLDEYSA